MTVRIREEFNEADLAWAAADPALAGVMGQLVQALQTLNNLGGVAFVPRAAEAGVVPPSELRAWGVL